MDEEWHEVDWLFEIVVYPINTEEEPDSYDERRKRKTTWTDYR